MVPFIIISIINTCRINLHKKEIWEVEAFIKNAALQKPLFLFQSGFKVYRAFFYILTITHLLLLFPFCR